MDKSPSSIPSEEEYQFILKNVANARQVWGIDSSQFKACLDVARCYLQALADLKPEESQDITTKMAALAITPSAAGGCLKPDDSQDITTKMAALAITPSAAGG